MATVVKTEGQHKGEFLLSEANGTLSREKGILSSGQVVEDGRLLKWSGSELVEAAGTIDSALDSTEDIAGIAYGSYDASADGPGGAVDTPIVYIARMAEVKASAVVLHESAVSATQKTAALTAALAAMNIILR